MFFGSSNPTRDPRYLNQAELSDITDEEFSILIDKPKITWGQRAFQVISFFLFLGPIRLVFGVVLFFGACTIMNIIRWWIHKLHINPERCKYLCYKMGAIGFRFLFMAFGVFYIKKTGKVDPEARFIAANHVAVCDPFLLLMMQPLTPVIKAETKKIGFLKMVLENVDPIFVERDKAHGYTKELISRADNPCRFPVMVFPEGTIAGGEYMLTFHRGAYCSQYKVQHVAIRYCMPFVPKGVASFTWKRFSIYEHIWQMLSMPPCYVTMDYLEPMTLAKEGEGDPSKFARNAQLTLANHLCLKATSRSSHELYRMKAEMESAEKAERVKNKIKDKTE